MKKIKNKILVFDFNPILWMILALIIHGIYYFTNGLVFNRMHIADGADNLLMFSYQYSGFMRGEYPLWNPLNRTGEALYLMNALFMANPISSSQYPESL